MFRVGLISMQVERGDGEKILALRTYRAKQCALIDIYGGSYCWSLYLEPASLLSSSLTYQIFRVTKGTKEMQDAGRRVQSKSVLDSLRSLANICR